MVGGMPAMTIPMGIPMPGQIASGQIPLATPMGQHPLQGTPVMMGHQGLILPQGGMLQQGAAPRAPMMGFMPRERFPGPGGSSPITTKYLSELCDVHIDSVYRWSINGIPKKYHTIILNELCKALSNFKKL